VEVNYATFPDFSKPSFGKRKDFLSFVFLLPYSNEKKLPFEHFPSQEEPKTLIEIITVEGNLDIDVPEEKIPTPIAERLKEM